MENRRPISIVQVDGTPSMVLTNATFEVSSTNPAAHDDDVAAGVNVDQDGNVLDVLVQSRRNAKASNASSAS